MEKPRLVRTDILSSIRKESGSSKSETSSYNAFNPFSGLISISSNLHVLACEPRVNLEPNLFYKSQESISDLK